MPHFDLCMEWRCRLGLPQSSKFKNCGERFEVHARFVEICFRRNFSRASVCNCELSHKLQIQPLHGGWANRIAPFRTNLHCPCIHCQQKKVLTANISPLDVGELCVGLFAFLLPGLCRRCFGLDPSSAAASSSISQIIIFEYYLAWEGNATCTAQGNNTIGTEAPPLPTVSLWIPPSCTKHSGYVVCACLHGGSVGIPHFHRFCRTVVVPSCVYRLLCWVSTLAYHIIVVSFSLCLVLFNNR